VKKYAIDVYKNNFWAGATDCPDITSVGAILVVALLKRRII